VPATFAITLLLWVGLSGGHTYRDFVKAHAMNSEFPFRVMPSFSATVPNLKFATL
jgi:hypothetical protein